MKTIILSDGQKEFNITLLENVSSVTEIVTELFAPALKGIGYTDEVINDSFRVLVESTGRPLKPLIDEAIKKAGLEMREELEYQKKQVELFKKDNYTLREDIAELNKRLDDAEQDILVNAVIGEQDIPANDVIESIQENQKEMVHRENFRCSECHDFFTKEEMNGNECPSCFEWRKTRHTCPNCGGTTLHENEPCDECHRGEPEEDHVPDDTPVETVHQVPDSNVWNTGTQGTIQYGWTVPPADEKSVEPEQQDIPEPKPEGPPNIEVPEMELAEDKPSIFVLSDEEKAENKAKCTERLKRVQELDDDGLWEPVFNQRLSCFNIKSVLPKLQCKVVGQCPVCPVGGNDDIDFMEHGLFGCSSCKKIFTQPIPVGCCPSCGIHDGDPDEDREGMREFCGNHWDVHRAKNGYEAGEEQNFRDGDDEDE